jgi:hypothetical protein
MADLGITGLKTEVDVQIYTNHQQAITGAIMNDTLIDTIDTLKNGGNLDAKSVDTAQLADNAVEALQINTGAVIEDKIGSGAVTTSKLAAKAVTSEKLADDAIVRTFAVSSGLKERSVDSVHAKEYYESIKFIAVVPNEGYEGDDFSIYAYTSRGQAAGDTPSMNSLNLWILEDTLAEAQEREVNAAKYMITGNESMLNTLQFIKQVGPYCTLYAIIDWNPVYNYKNTAGFYSPLVWGTSWTNPSSILVQKIKSDDPRIINWDSSIKTSQLKNTLGVSTTDVMSQKISSSLLSMTNGLVFNFDIRAARELKAMQIIKKAYFSFLNYTPTEVGIGVMGTMGQSGPNFWFGFGSLDGTQSLGTISLIPYTSLPTGVKSYYVENQKCKFYVEIDFDKYIELGGRDIVWDWSTPICKMTNIIDKNDQIWDSLLAPKSKFNDFTKLNFGVDGDSITAGNQWSSYVTQQLKLANHHNVAVGSSTFACKKQTLNQVEYKTQEYDDPNFAGISDGWQSTTDPVEIQKRCNNCAKVHIQKFISEVSSGTYPTPDIFAFSFGTNDIYNGMVEDALNGKSLPANDSDVLFTMAGGARWAIQKIMTTYPNCRIFVLSPIQSSDVTRNNNNLTKIEILKGICQGLSVQFIDMYSNCGITEKLETGTGIYLSDGLHPNTAGKKLMGAYASAILRNTYFASL